MNLQILIDTLQVWYLPGVAERFGIGKCSYLHTLLLKL